MSLGSVSTQIVGKLASGSVLARATGGTPGPILVIDCGQSNTGPGDITSNLSAGNAVYAGTFPDVRYAAMIDGNTDPPPFSNYPLQSLAPVLYVSQLHLASEMVVGTELDRRLPDQIVYAKMSLVGSSLATQWKPGSGYPSSGPDLAHLFVSFVEGVIATVSPSRIVVRWGQGESDAGGSGTSAAYAANLTTLRTFVDAALSPLVGNTPIWWIITRLNSDYVNAAGGVGAFTTTVQAQQASFVAGALNAILVNQDSFIPGQGDHTHYSADQYCAIGFLIAQAVGTALGIHLNPTCSWSYATIALAASFTDTSIDHYGSVASWAWTFGDGGTSTLQNPSHTYAGPGGYTATLTITDNNGQADTFHQTVTVSAVGYTSDATSGVGIPQTNSEWTAFLASISDVQGNPTSIGTCQDASGGSVDANGVFSLAASGTGISFENAVAGWASKAIDFTDNGTGTLSTTAAGQTDLSTADEAILLYALINTPGLRSIMGLGTPTGNRVDMEQRTGSNLLVMTAGATVTNGTLSPYNAAPQALMLISSATNSFQAMLTAAEKVVGTYTAGAGKKFEIGDFARGSPAMSVLYWARFTGAAARRTTAQWKAMLQGLKVPNYASIPWS